MAKKKYFKKKAVLRAISKYHRRKLNLVTDIYIDNDGNTFIDGQQTNSLIIGEMLTGNTSEFQHLGKDYGFVKLRGVAVEAVPVEFSNARYSVGLCVGQANDSIQFGSIRTQPNILLINSQGKSRGYFKINSEFTSTNSIELFNNVALLPFSQGAGRIRYTIKVTLYLTFKTNL